MDQHTLNMNSPTTQPINFCSFEAGDHYGDALCLTPYNEADYSKEITISLGRNRFAEQWQPKTMPIGAFIALLSKHTVGGKDGMAFVPGDMAPGKRVKTAVKALYAGCLDIDTGTPTELIEAALLKLGCLAIRYSTHSAGIIQSNFKWDKFVKHAGNVEPTTDLVRDFLASVERWDPSVVDEAEFVGTDHNENGVVVQVAHPPMPKHRILIPFEVAFDIGKEAKASSHVEAMKKWAKVLEALARLLGVPFDTSCTDPSRLFYLPRHDKDRPFGASIVAGPLFDWRKLELNDPMEKLAAALTKGKGKSVTEEGRKLAGWCSKCAYGFQIADVIDAYAPDRIRHTNGGSYEIECPFDEDHSNPGDPGDRACFVRNAGEGPSEFFTISCRHETCRDKTFLDMLGKMLKDGWFEKSVLEDEQFNAIIDGEATKTDPNLSGHECFEFDDEDQLVKAINAKCALAPHGDEVRVVFWDKHNVPIFRRKRDAETALAKYRFLAPKMGKDGNRADGRNIPASRCG